MSRNIVTSSLRRLLSACEAACCLIPNYSSLDIYRRETLKFHAKEFFCNVLGLICIRCSDQDARWTAELDSRRGKRYLLLSAQTSSEGLARSRSKIKYGILRCVNRNRGAKSTTHLHLIRSVGKHRSVPPLPFWFCWCGAYLSTGTTLISVVYDLFCTEFRWIFKVINNISVTKYNGLFQLFSILSNKECRFYWNFGPISLFLKIKVCLRNHFPL
jgi:hypothetical protein